MKLRLPLMSAAMLASLSVSAYAQTAEPAEAGKLIYERANCVGCHKWSGVGGGGYGGAALSLRATALDKEQIVETITCGRPGTGMPHFTPSPYHNAGCYGLSEDDVKDIMPPAATVVLRPEEIQIVADYVLTNIKGKGDPTLADCTAFFSADSRVCDVYRPRVAGARHPMPTPATTGQ